MCVNYYLTQFNHVPSTRPVSGYFTSPPFISFYKCKNTPVLTLLDSLSTTTGLNHLQFGVTGVG